MAQSFTTELELMYDALRSRYGIVVLVSDFRLASQRLYKARASAMDSDLDCLSFLHSPYNPDEELFIVKRPKEDAAKRNGTTG